jgi:superfamily II DNA helicase RecQ
MQRVTKFASFRGQQLEALYLLCNKRRDVIFNAATSSGKSLVFHMLPFLAGQGTSSVVSPSALLVGTVLVIVPTTALQESHRLDLKTISDKYDYKSVCIGSLCKTHAVEKRFLAGEFVWGESHFVFHFDSIAALGLITPEKFVDLSADIVAMAAQGRLLAVIIDECHLASDFEWCAT